MVDTTIPLGGQGEADEADVPRTIDFAHLFSVLYNRTLLIAAVTILFLAASVVFSLLLKNYYTSTTSILVDPEGSRIVEGEINSGTRATEARALNQQYILVSTKVLAEVVKSENLAEDPDFGAGQPYEADPQKRAQRALEALRRAITAEINKASFVIDLSVTAGDPVKAAKIANNIANTYIRTRLEMNNGVLRQATMDLSAQLASLEKAVEDGDRAIQVYKAERNLVDLAGRTPAEQQITETNTEITRISGVIAENEALISELALARSNPDYLRSTPDSSLTPAIIELRTRYHTALEQQSVLQSSFGDRHPSLMSAKARTRAVSALLDKQLKDFTTSLSRNGEKLKSQRDLLRKNLATLKASLNESDQSMVRLRELERKLASDRAVYESFLLRTRQLSGQERTVSENPQIISVAQVPLSKAGPKRSLIVAGATVLGFLFGCGIALVRDREPGNVARADQPPENIERAPRRRYYGWLHRPARQQEQSAAEAEAQEKKSARHDATPLVPLRRLPARAAAQKQYGDVRDIAGQLIAEAGDHRNDCTVLYSEPARANIDSIVLQLARAMAQSGKTVLLIDADSVAGLTRHVSATGRPGLFDSLSLRRIAGDFVTFPDMPGLRLMPAGRRSPRIITRREDETGTLVDWLAANRNTFDHILVYAGRADLARAIPAVEMAADRFAVLGREALDETARLLGQRGLSPIVPLLIEEDMEANPVKIRPRSNRTGSVKAEKPAGRFTTNSGSPKAL
jgi:uncharacterized protein involved in exopolysaccharide biosynthesis